MDESRLGQRAVDRLYRRYLKGELTMIELRRDVKEEYDLKVGARAQEVIEDAERRLIKAYIIDKIRQELESEGNDE